VRNLAPAQPRSRLGGSAGNGSGSAADMLIWKAKCRRRPVHLAALSVAGFLVPVGRDLAPPTLAPLALGVACLQVVVRSWADHARLELPPGEGGLVGATPMVHAQKTRGCWMDGLCWQRLAYC
jgi:hypothetical protein